MSGKLDEMDKELLGETNPEDGAMEDCARTLSSMAGKKSINVIQRGAITGNDKVSHYFIVRSDLKILGSSTIPTRLVCFNRPRLILLGLSTVFTHFVLFLGSNPVTQRAKTIS